MPSRSLLTRSICSFSALACAAALSACSGGGGGSFFPHSAQTAVPIAPTPPAVAGPASSSMSVTFSSSNPTITLPTVGTVASQITFPSDFAPDGTQVTIAVSAGGTTTTGLRRRIAGASRSPQQSIPPPGWSATITSNPSTFLSGTPVITIASQSANGTIPAQNTLSFLGQSSPGGPFDLLGALSASTVVNGVVTFDPALSACTPQGGEASLPSSWGVGSGSSGTSGSSSSFVAAWNIPEEAIESKFRGASGAARSTAVASPAPCAPPASSSPPALGAGALYVSDPGIDAVLLFPAGASGDPAPFVPLTAAPPVATDFAGELVTAGKNADVTAINIRAYGSTAVEDQLQNTNENPGAGVNAIGADPLGAHVADIGFLCTTSTPGRACKSDIAIQIFDRAQGGITVPSGGWSPIGLGKVYPTMWLDNADDAILLGATQGSSGSCGASEYVPSFGLSGTTYSPFRSIYGACAGAQVTTDAAGNLYVAIAGSGVFVWAPGTGGTVPPTYQLTTPGATGVAVDSNLDVYVSDPETLQQNADGSFTLLTPAAINVYGPANTWGSNPTPIRTISGPATGLVSPAQLAIVPVEPTTPPSQSIQVSPMAIAFTASGQSQTIAVSETGFSGTFTQTNSCAGIASIAAASGGFTVTAQAAGTCFGTISDGQGATADIGITVTTTGFTLNAARRH